MWGNGIGVGDGDNEGVIGGGGWKMEGRRVGGGRVIEIGIMIYNEIRLGGKGIRSNAKRDRKREKDTEI